uniref:Diguanylate cyclase n=1 Tax=Mizugakiibacter sediminis TaxID=1475481 RepID=A0A0U1PBM8_9GAMM
MPGRGRHTFELDRLPLRDARGRPFGTLGCGRDLTDMLEAQAARAERDALQRALFAHNPLPVLIYDETSLRILDVNAAATRLYGWTRDEFLGLDLYGIRPVEEAERLRAYVSQPRPDHVACVQGWRHRRKDGTLLDVEITSTRVERDGRAVRIAIVRDVTEERRQQRALGDIERRYRDLVEAGLGMIWSHDLEGRLLMVNTAMAQALGHTAAELVGRNLVDFVPEQGRQAFYEYLMRIRNLRRDAGVVQVLARGGERRVWQYRNVYYADGDPQPYVLGSAQDITLRYHYELRLREQNQKDALTGAYNRRYLEHFAARATPGQRWGCIVVDLDHFKHYNDTYGHEKGDEILLGITRFLQQNSRAGDAVVRLGGDEFLILLPDASTAVVREVAGRLREGVARNEICVDFSMGWAVRQDDEPVEATIRRADQSLIQVRAATRGREARMPRH